MLFRSRVLKDIKGDVIMNFSPEAIREAFQLVSEGPFEYTEADSLACYRDTKKAATTIKSWLLEEFQGIKGNALINAPRSNFIPAVDLLILMLSRVLGKEDATKFRKEFFGFIVEIARGRKIRWSKVINDALTEQLSTIGASRKFYLNSYLVYMLLKGKTRSSALGEVALVSKGNVSIWRCYPKWRIERRWNDFVMRNDGWEYAIYKELKGEVAVPRVSNSAQQALKRHGDFFVHHQQYSYIRIYGSDIEPYQLPRYVSNRLMLMEMMR